MKLAITITIVVLLLAGLYIRLFLIIDSCLDRGGTYNYESCDCDLNKSHSNDSFHFCYFNNFNSTIKYNDVKFKNKEKY